MVRGGCFELLVIGWRWGGGGHVIGFIAVNNKFNYKLPNCINDFGCRGGSWVGVGGGILLLEYLFKYRK